MARIRSIKPEFCQSESIGCLSRDARLLFVQLWTIVDDDGRARAASRMLASLLYPYDDDAPTLIEAWLAELEAKSLIRRYEVDGSKYLDIPTWTKHQRIDHATKSKLPEFREEFAKPRETLARPPEPFVPDPSLIHTSLPSSNSSCEERKDPVVARARSTPRASRPRSPKLPLPSDWKPRVEEILLGETLGMDEGRIAQQAQKMRDWAAANAITRADWNAQFRNWLTSPYQNNGSPNGKRSDQGRASGARSDFFAGIAKAAANLTRDGSVAGSANEEIPLGRVNIDGEPAGGG